MKKKKYKRNIIELNKGINQIKNYGLDNLFKNPDEMKAWIDSLNELELKNFLSLNIPYQEINFSNYCLINYILLNEEDYLDKVKALVSIDNAEGCYHLIEGILAKEEITSPKFYQDIEKIKKADTARYALWIVGKDEFISSPYHDEDLTKLVNIKAEGEECIWTLEETIARIAENVDSINSPYHRDDINLILSYGPKATQSLNSYPKHTISYLAIDKVSLNSPYHLRDMKLLADNPEIGKYLYLLMTDEKTVNSPNYTAILEDMIQNQDDIKHLLLLCIYTIGLDKTFDEADNIYMMRSDVVDLITNPDFEDELEKVAYKFDFIETTAKEAIEHKSLEEKPKSLVKRFFNRK